MSNFPVLTRDFSCALDVSEHEKYVKGLLAKAVDTHLLPGGVYGAVTPKGSVLIPFGSQTYDPGSPVVTEKNFFDVASVTKSIPTSILILRLIDQGIICHKGFDEPVSMYLPELSGQYSEMLTIGHLLSFAFELNLTERLEKLGELEEIEQAIMTAGLVRPPGFFHYANTTSFIAMRLIESLYKTSYEDAARRFVFEPLGLDGGFLSGKMSLSNVSPSENGVDGLIHGVVHDEFSRHIFRVSKKQSGAAGLFLNGDDGIKILRSFCGAKFPSILGQYENLFGVSRFGANGFMGEIRKNQLNDPSHRYGLGFDILDRSYGPCGHCTDKTMLITGFTGCHLMLQPSRGVGMFLFSNATFPKRHHRSEGKSPIFELRRAIFHSLQVCKHCFE